MIAINFNNLKEFFPAGGVSNKEVVITQLKVTANQHVATGLAILPTTETEQKIVLYTLILENGEVDYRAVSALCPHQGADISRDTLKVDGNVYCSLHKRPICIYSKYNQAFKVIKRDSQFVITKTL